VRRPSPSESGEALSVEVLDHLIVTTNAFLSLKQRELL